MVVNVFLKKDLNPYPLISICGAVSEDVGGVSPFGWSSPPEITLIDEALEDYSQVWAAAGHPHAVFPSTFHELKKLTHATAMIVGD